MWADPQWLERASGGQAGWGAVPGPVPLSHCLWDRAHVTSPLKDPVPITAKPGDNGPYHVNDCAQWAM